MYEPSHGSAPDIAGQDKANPLATILSLAMMFRYTFNDHEKSRIIEHAVKKTLADGYRTQDIFSENMNLVGCEEMGNAVLQRIKDL
jgi:3-isopropylmalate dehydrogenase